MTIMELMNEYDQNCEGMLEATEQSVYVSLVLIWNRLRRPEWFDVSRPELMRKAGIKGKDRMDRARKGLEEKGFITSESTGRTRPRKYHLEPLPARPETGLTRPETDLAARSKTGLARPEMSLVRPETGLETRSEMDPARPETGLTTRPETGLKKPLDLKQVQHWTRNGSKLDLKQVTSQRE